MDKDEAYNHGEYPTYEKACSAAQEIVRGFLQPNRSEGITPDELLAQYALYGDDPVILPNEPGENKKFSASEYAEAIVKTICLNNK